MSDWEWFSIKSSINFKEHIVREDGSLALVTYDTFSSNRKENDFAVHIYPNLQSSNTAKLCEPSLTGVSNPQIMHLESIDEDEMSLRQGSGRQAGVSNPQIMHLESIDEDEMSLRQGSGRQAGVSNPEPITFTHCDNGALCIQSGSLTSLTSAENLPSPASFNDTSLSSSSQGVTPTAVWGRVSENAGIYLSDALCKPPVTIRRHIYDPVQDDPASAYAFCSEHNNKTVLICISQMKDNEKLARDIFETFRWTK